MSDRQKYLLGKLSYAQYPAGYNSSSNNWFIRDGDHSSIDLTANEMTELVKVYCEVNGLPFPTLTNGPACNPDFNEIEAAKGQEIPLEAP